MQTLSLTLNVWQSNVKVLYSPASPYIPKGFALSEDSQVSSTFLSKMKVGVEHFWNGTDRGNPTFYEKNRSHFHLAHHKSHTGRYGIDIEPVGRETDN